MKLARDGQLIEAAFCLGTLLNLSPRVHTPEAVRGVYYAITASEGTSVARAEADRVAVDAAIVQIQQTAANLVEDMNNSRMEADRLVVALTQSTHEFRVRCDKEVEEAEAKFNGLQNVMEAKVALKASISYLETRITRCSSAANTCLRHFVCQRRAGIPLILPV